MPGINVNKDQLNKKNIMKLYGYQKIIHRVFSPMNLGRLTIELPDGNTLVYGQGEGAVQANILVKNNEFFKKCVLFGDVGFGESYVDGDWETDNITDVIDWMISNIENHPTLMDDQKKKKPVNILKIFNNIIHLIKKNSLKGSRKNIQEHYDLGNDFFKLFLDPSMTYSAAYFKYSQQPIEDAQMAKYEQLCSKIHLTHTDHLLEIGSGWGGFAIYAAKNYGCKVTTVTISQEQYAFACQRIKDARLEDKIDIKICDYRELTGTYDKIVSIEMLEAVGHDYYETYFARCQQCLKDDGVLALQVILSPDHRYDSFRKNIDWIQKHIFPGSLLPSYSRIQHAINKTGRLCLYDYEDMTNHYVKTLNIWRETFNQKLNEIKKLGLSDEFIRKWNYYWSYCEGAFKTRNITVAQIVYSYSNNRRLR